MTASGVHLERKAAPWGIAVLLLVSVFINYVDRGNLSIAAPVLAPELALTPAQLGWLFSAFFWTYSVFQILSGWLVDRFSVNWVYAAGYLLWSAATLATGLTGTFAALFAVRLLLGAGESVVYPACSRILVTHFSETQRGLANALVDAGSKAGPALGTLLGGLLVARWGWRALFVIVGAVSLLWLLPWYLWAPPAQPAAERRARQSPGFIEILGRREAWGTSLGMFCFGYVWYFLLSWLPSYLVMERHFSLESMAVLGSLPYWAVAASAVLCGWASDRWIARGSSPTRVRKTFVASGLVLMCVFMLPAVLAPTATSAVGMLILVYLSIGLFSSNVWAVTQALAGPLAAGKWTGIQNAVGNLGGVISPLVTGLIVARTHRFFLAFLAAAVMSGLGAAAYLLMVGRIEPLGWRGQGDDAA
ncbi:MAG TPA: MFS transporter [Bryobacteraceae bacterium]|nr:MFS transporter [Bryobacteraceae bacterium]